MDFNFGEIVEPVSRAFYDDYEDPSLNLPFKRPSWIYCNEEGKAPVIQSIKNFIIIEGVNALNVVHPSILKKTSPIARLDGHKVEIFQLETSTFCVVEEKDLNYFATITELLEPWINATENCTIVSLQSATEYKAEEVPESCFIRAINSKFTDVPALEAPNFITGVGAGVGTFRKISSLSFSCFVAYIDLYDVFSIRTILSLLKRLGLPHDDSVALKPLHHKSDLYM